MVSPTTAEADSWFVTTRLVGGSWFKVHGWLGGFLVRNWDTAPKVMYTTAIHDWSVWCTSLQDSSLHCPWSWKCQTSEWQLMILERNCFPLAKTLLFTYEGAWLLIASWFFSTNAAASPAHIAALRCESLMIVDAASGELAIPWGASCAHEIGPYWLSSVHGRGWW